MRRQGHIHDSYIYTNIQVVVDVIIEASSGGERGRKARSMIAILRLLMLHIVVVDVAAEAF